MRRITQLKRDIYLSLIHNLGPMSNTEIWEHLWGSYSPIRNVADSIRILGFGYADPYYETTTMAKEGYLVKIGNNNSNIIWRAV